MANFATERVLDVHHWNDSLFSFKTTRDPGLRFENGHFVMLGLPGAVSMGDAANDDKPSRPIMRAYSIASANYEAHLEFFSIKVQHGALTSRLQHLKPGDEIIVNRKTTGTLLLSDLKPAKRLYLLGTGTGLAPFLSIAKDPDVYDRFEKIVLVHGVRQVSELAYGDYLTRELPQNDFFGELVREKFVYYPTVTREPFRTMGRMTDLIESGRLTSDLGLPPLHPAEDRVMICGSPSMLADLRGILDARGFVASPHTGMPGDYVFERAFVEK